MAEVTSPDDRLRAELDAVLQENARLRTLLDVANKEARVAVRNLGVAKAALDRIAKQDIDRTARIAKEKTSILWKTAYSAQIARRALDRLLSDADPRQAAVHAHAHAHAHDQTDP